jgi:hypothetical protein
MEHQKQCKYLPAHHDQGLGLGSFVSNLLDQVGPDHFYFLKGFANRAKSNQVPNERVSGQSSFLATAKVYLVQGSGCF